MGNLDDVEEEYHGSNKLADAISKLDKVQHIKPASKNNASSRLFDRKVQVKELLNVLGDTAEHADIGRNLRSVSQHKFPLSKPLERKEADRIKRTTGFDEVKAKLDRWNAVVARNRAVEHKTFPLIDAEDKIRQPVDAYLTKYKISSNLEKELELLQPSNDEVKESHFPLTLAEMIEHRKESARLRAKQSYKEAKARRQSKIKSKKFHRIQRKEKIKTQLKEFEMLQKTNPEEALKKLEQLEKTRAEERVTLRHKSTGHWAKNKLVRAKYDKDTRQQLAQQLAISRELTQKITTDDKSDSDDDSIAENQNETIEDSSNPWIPSQTPSNDYTDFVSGYKKFWSEQNKATKNDTNTELHSNVEDSLNKICDKKINKDVNKNDQLSQKSISHKSNLIKKPSNMKKAKTIKKVISTTDWNVSSTLQGTVEELFDKFESDLNGKCSEKIYSLKKSLLSKRSTKKSKTSSKKDDQDELSKLSFHLRKKAPQIDEELYEGHDSTEKEILEQKTILSSLKNDLNKKNEVVGEIDPNKFVAPKIRHLQSTVPDIDFGDDHLDDHLDNKQIVIAEAFEDDDIVANFQAEKQSEIDKDKPQIDDAFLPGWGTWTGKNLAAPKRKRKCFINTTYKLSRKDDKKDNLIIKESTNEKLKSHLVSELPFPFTSVKDFESTVRAPVGNTFVPETAFKKITKPGVLVKTGIVIKAMDESHLINSKKNNNKLRLKNK